MGWSRKPTLAWDHHPESAPCITQLPQCHAGALLPNRNLIILFHEVLHSLRNQKADADPGASYPSVLPSREAGLPTWPHHSKCGGRGNSGRLHSPNQWSRGNPEVWPRSPGGRSLGSGQPALCLGSAQPPTASGGRFECSHAHALWHCPPQHLQGPIDLPCLPPNSTQMPKPNPKEK